MKRILLLAACILVVSTSTNFSQSWQMVWSEEFSGTELNEENWTYETGPDWYNEELQSYTDREKNVRVENGMLIIEAHKEALWGNDYTSARIITENKKSFMYGRIEARIKMPFGQGMWPAFWMLGQNISQVSWPACGEIDIMEMIGGGGREKITHAAIHWQQEGEHAMYGGEKRLASGTLADAFHTFTIMWNEESISWLFDGNEFHVADITPVELSEFHQEFFIILNVAVGGTWPGSPDETTEFPQQMQVDYVRVFQQVATGVEDAPLVPIESSLQVYPNPFNPSANIVITSNIQKATTATIGVFNLLGEQVYTEEIHFKHGVNNITWNPAPGLNSGTYFINVVSPGLVLTKKAMFLK